MNTIHSMLVVCNDAGGAEIISAYVRAMKNPAGFFCYVAGPAEKIFASKGIESIRQSESGWRVADIFDAHPDAVSILLDIGWSSQIELDALHIAKERGVKTIVYLDHWVHYKERFGFPHPKWKENFPDEIWVGDSYAYVLACKSLSEIPIRLEPNQYFLDVKKEYAIWAQEHHPIEKERHILFLSEPISERINPYGDTDHFPLTEWDILESFFEYVVAVRENSTVTIRFHPSEQKDKYDELLQKYSNDIHIKKSLALNLYADIAESSIIVGMESMALVVSMLCGKPTVSFLPHKDMRCPLPFEEIIKVKRPEDLNIF